MDTLIERINNAATEDRSVTFVVGGQVEEVSWSSLHEMARAAAAELQARSIKPGDRVALLSSTSRDLLVAMQAVWLVGATVVVLPLPMRMASLPDFIAATKTRITAAEAAAVLVAPELSAFAGGDDAEHPSWKLTEITQSARSGVDFVAPTYDSGDLAILQFTSGSTSAPKGVMLPNHTITANIDAMTKAVEVDDDSDVFVSWLPLYHDMGLIGFCVLPMALGSNLVLGAPQDFLGAPRRWMEWISDYSGTLTAGPNFSYVLAGRGLKRPGAPLDLSTLRIALNGAEPVDPKCVEDFIAAGEPHGLRPGAVFPAFGMAELAIAGSFPEPLSGMQLDVVDGEMLELEGVAREVAADHSNSRSMVKLGWPVPGLEFQIVSPESGAVMPERHVGELQIRGTSVTPGYYNQPEATAELFDDDWLKTGDLGYLIDGQLVLCGRIKDLIIVGGRNVYPQDIERAVGQLEGVRAGNVAAFSVAGRKGKEGIVVVAETRSVVSDELVASVRQAVVSSVGVPCQEVVFVKPSTLPKTSSGKLQRSLTAKQYSDGLLKLAG